MIFWNWLYLDKSPFKSDPVKSAAWNRGDYLVMGLGHCAACHTPKNIMFGDETDKPLTGGVVENWFANDLAGGQMEGLGQWSPADIEKFLRHGRQPPRHRRRFDARKR